MKFQSKLLLFLPNIQLLDIFLSVVELDVQFDFFVVEKLFSNCFSSGLFYTFLHRYFP